MRGLRGLLKFDPWSNASPCRWTPQIFSQCPWQKVLHLLQCRSSETSHYLHDGQHAATRGKKKIAKSLTQVDSGSNSLLFFLALNCFHCGKRRPRKAPAFCPSVRFTSLVKPMTPSTHDGLLVCLAACFSWSNMLLRLRFINKYGRLLTQVTIIV